MDIKDIINIKALERGKIYWVEYDHRRVSKERLREMMHVFHDINKKLGINFLFVSDEFNLKDAPKEIHTVLRKDKEN